MRQVPASYLLIGNGRVARHLSHYFALLNLNFSTWHRPQSLDVLQEKIQKSSHILVLISDKALQSFIDEHLRISEKAIIHCSGSLICEGAIGAHPLMTFGPDLYDLTTYQSIPFMIDHDAPEDLLAELPNIKMPLHTAQKAKYHALCVMSGNFSCMLWQKLFHDFEHELNLPKEMAHAYLKQQMQNLLIAPESALTGPVMRGDQVTIEKNIKALANDPFQEIYKNFVKCYQEIKPNGFPSEPVLRTEGCGGRE